MATNVIMPVLGVSQDFGKIVHWHKTEGDTVHKGEPLLEVETDKAVVDIEAPASGVVGKILATEGQEVPVTEIIAVILAPGETNTVFDAPPAEREAGLTNPVSNKIPLPVSSPSKVIISSAGTQTVTFPVSPLAVRIAAQNNIDLTLVKPEGSRIEKEDILNYLKNQNADIKMTRITTRTMASPKARRLAAERSFDLISLKGTGPLGAVLANDIPLTSSKPVSTIPNSLSEIGGVQNLSAVWRIMADRTTQSWTTVPHFFLLREVNASRLISWRERLLKQETVKITFTDLLVKVVSTALKRNPAVNASWENGTLIWQPQINVGIAVAQDNGLVVPVIHSADLLTVNQIALARIALVEKARSGRLHTQDISEGTFTISNLGMYGVDAFNAIINSPQAAILAVGRILDRVVAIKGVPVVQPTMILSLSCDHRVVDGTRGAQFLELVADLIEEPAGLIK